MQSIKTNANRQEFTKRFVLETIDFLRYKVDSDTLTADECEALARTLAQSLDLRGTAEDFARFYGKSVNNVKVVICRKLTAAPVRKVLYSFGAFCRVIPKSWYDGREEPES